MAYTVLRIVLKNGPPKRLRPQTGSFHDAPWDESFLTGFPNIARGILKCWKIPGGSCKRHFRILGGLGAPSILKISL